jgi:transcriptional regulator with XRE-family HTH domain
MSPNAALARAIRSARLSVRLTQEALGARVGVKSRAVYRWEAGRALPRPRQRSRLVTALAQYDARAAESLAHAFAAHASGLAELPPAPPPPPPPSPQQLELAVFAMADELDLPPRRLRRALTQLFARARAAGYQLADAERDLTARVAADAG